METLPEDKRLQPIGHVALVADVDAGFRKSLSGILKQSCHCRRVYEAASLEDVHRQLADNAEISVVLVELAFPLLCKYADITTIRIAYPDVRLVVTADSQVRDDMLNAIQCGAHGYIVKGSDAARITTSLNAVIAGQIALPWSVSNLMRTNYPPPAATLRRKSGLTSRQQQILRLIGAGKSNKEIARTLDLTENTVKVHVHALYRAIGVNDRLTAASLLSKAERSNVRSSLA